MTDYSVRAIHVHHGLQKEADHWVDHCNQVCDVLHIPLQVEYLNLSPKKGESVEELARTARYTVLKKSVQADEILLTATNLPNSFRRLFTSIEYINKPA